MDPKSLGIFIKQKRIEVGLTQQEFAQRFGLSLRALRSLEQGSGDVLLTSAMDILNALGFDVRPSEFLYQKMEHPAQKIRDTEEILTILSKYLPVLRCRFGVQKIGVFGSTARGEQDKSSDIDLLVEFKERTTLQGESQLYEFLKRMLKTNRIDLVTADRSNEIFLEKIMKEIRYA